MEQHREAVCAIDPHHGLVQLSVSGSIARGDADPDSDVDLLVVLPPGTSGLALGALLMDTQDLLTRKVDVVTERGLHPALRESVLREAQLV